jgi:hypothetical protein
MKGSVWYYTHIDFFSAADEFAHATHEPQRRHALTCADRSAPLKDRVLAHGGSVAARAASGSYGRPLGLRPTPSSASPACNDYGWIRLIVSWLI